MNWPLLPALFLASAFSSKLGKLSLPEAIPLVNLLTPTVRFEDPWLIAQCDSLANTLAKTHDVASLKLEIDNLFRLVSENADMGVSISLIDTLDRLLVQSAHRKLLLEYGILAKLNDYLGSIKWKDMTHDDDGFLIISHLVFQLAEDGEISLLNHDQLTAILIHNLTYPDELLRSDFVNALSRLLGFNEEQIVPLELPNNTLMRLLSLDLIKALTNSYLVTEEMEGKLKLLYCFWWVSKSIENLGTSTSLAPKYTYDLHSAMQANGIHEDLTCMQQDGYLGSVKMADEILKLLAPLSA